MQVLTMDFETRSKINIKKCGSFKYAQDQSTSVLCLAYSFGKGTIEIWYPSLSFPDSVLSHINSGLEVHCHNAEFEFAIWNYCFSPKMNLPKISWAQMRCSSARAAVLSFPRSLAQLSSVLKVAKEKDMIGNRLMMKLSTPKKHKDGTLQFYEGTKEEYQRLYDYCKSDV